MLLRVYVFFTTQFSIFISLCNAHYIISLSVLLLIHPWCKLPETHVDIISPLVMPLCHPMDCCPQGSSVHGILQARVLEPLAMPSSRGSSWPWGKHESLPLPALAGGFITLSHLRNSPETYKYLNLTVKGLLFGMPHICSQDIYLPS